MSDRGDGSSSLYASMVEQHWSSVYRLVYQLTGNSHDADDLAQETFLRGLNHWHTLEPGSNVRGWLMRIATNVFLDGRRRQKRVQLGPLDVEVASGDKPPEHTLEVAEQSALVKAALEDLSDLTRLVFHLRVTEDLPFREIAGMANISEEAARWHMHQARAKLVKRFQPGSETS